MTDEIKPASKCYYEDLYSREGFAAQRRYPAEELSRFMGRHYFGLPPSSRGGIRILEVGCGLGANLWMIAREGFDAYGVDLSAEAIHLCGDLLASYGVTAELRVADMTNTPFDSGYFDAVVDIYSACCFDSNGFAMFVDEVARLLKPSGRFFSYTPSKKSDAFLNYAPAVKLDGSTLDGIRRADSPYYGNNYPFRFTTGAEYAHALAKRGLRTIYNETVGRTYRSGAEYFEFIAIAAEKDA